MALMNLQGVRLAFGGPLILDRIDFQIEKGERVCLVGRNGEGKSTLMKIIGGEITPDSGEMIRQQGLKVTRLTQEVPHDISGTVFEVVAGGLGHIVKLLADYHGISARLAHEQTPALMNELERVHHELETAGGWEANNRIETVITRLKLPSDAMFNELSGGYKRRVLLGKALVSEPDLLLLDEPTNHLDIQSIDWLEEFLLSYAGTILFVTHDRMLLKKLATRIVELDRGKLTSWPGDYNTYLERKQALLNAAAKEDARFDKRLSQEEVWIRQGIKARRTRNEGRVRALEEMRKQRSQRRELSGAVKMDVQKAEASGKLVVVAEDVGFGYGGRAVIKDFSTTIMRGDKIGIIGPNGSGKTTLLKLLLGDLKPETGKIKPGARLEVIYFDQHRAHLNDERSVAENIGEGNDTVMINGNPRHVIGYLQDFLFSPERARTPVKVLSGGERNRLLLAKLFTKPSNVLVLDEPTNDLDGETLELLEELLLDYPGTVLLVSHDRAFLNNVVTSTLVFEGGGKVAEYVGGYDDWLRQRPRENGETPKKKTLLSDKQAAQPKRAAKLSYKEQKELETLPGKIEKLEAEQGELFKSMSDASFYQKSKDEIARTQERLKSIEDELAVAYERWEMLEAIEAESGKG
jgi:ABC transport system ATP-binding/permease protein